MTDYRRLYPNFNCVDLIRVPKEVRDGFGYPETHVGVSQHTLDHVTLERDRSFSLDAMKRCLELSNVRYCGWDEDAVTFLVVSEIDQKHYALVIRDNVVRTMYAMSERKIKALYQYGCLLSMEEVV